MVVQQDWGGLADQGPDPQVQQGHPLSPASPWAVGNSPGRQHEDQGNSSSAEGSPGQDQEQPAGLDSDDNFEVSDDVDERQVGIMLCTAQLPCLASCCSLSVSS